VQGKMVHKDTDRIVYQSN